VASATIQKQHGTPAGPAGSTLRGSRFRY